MISAGQPTSRIWIVGEAPGVNEEREGQPFVGASGSYLMNQLATINIRRKDCYITNVCHVRPPGNDIEKFFAKKSEAKQYGLGLLDGRYPMRPVRDGRALLWEQLRTYKPDFILALGNTALWALTGHTGITRWRGSQLSLDLGEKFPTKIIPTYHPAAIMRDMSLEPDFKMDLKRSARELTYREIRYPAWDFVIAPSYADTVAFLQDILNKAVEGSVWLAVDIETARRQIACVGIATSAQRAICIPFLHQQKREGYWSYSEEIDITILLRQILTHPNVRCVFQNGMYDLQYFAAQWGYLPNLLGDTMVQQHLCWPGRRKSLDYMSSYYCSYHLYWKDDGKTWHDSGDELQWWRYNCVDCVRTYEIHEALNRVIDAFELRSHYNFQMNELHPVVLRMMLRGVLFDKNQQRILHQEITRHMQDIRNWLCRVLRTTFNPQSPIQCANLFYDQLGLPKLLNNKTKRPTADSDALEVIARRNPLLRPLIKGIILYRSLAVANGNVLETTISPDGRMRCSYNPAGPETFRFSSSADVFGNGMNLQNITKGDSDD